jgi:hypothetical protein
MILTLLLACRAGAVTPGARLEGAKFLPLSCTGISERTIGPVIRFSIALTLAASALAGGAPALAQAGSAPVSAEHGVDWTLDTSGVKAPRKKKGAASQTAPAAQDAERAARLAEGRRKFFENKPDGQNGREVPQFGGYNAATDSGTFRPGAQFRF